MPYELQKFSADVPSVSHEHGNGKNEVLGFEEQVRHFHDEFNDTLTKFLHEIANQEQDHFSGNVLHIIYRLVMFLLNRETKRRLRSQTGLQRVLRPDERRR